MPSIEKARKYIQQLFTLSRGEMSRTERFLRFMVELTIYCSRQLKRDNAAQMAAALTYRTLFSLVPTVVLSVVVLQSFANFGDLQQDVQKRAFVFFGLEKIALDTGDDQPKSNTDEVLTPEKVEEIAPVLPPGAKLELRLDDSWVAVAPISEFRMVQPDNEIEEAKEDAVRDSVTKILNSITSKASQINFGGIGVAGILLLVWGALMLAVTVESTFNRIFKCPKGRPWHRRIPIYWSVLTLGPILAAVSISLAGSLSKMLGVDNSLLNVSGRLTGVIASWALFSVIYVLMPNTKVRLKPAMIGASVAAVLWEFAKFGFAYYIAEGEPFSNLYGSLALMPMFLIWLHLTWMIVLFGLELTYTLQGMEGNKFELERNNQQSKRMCDARAVIPVLTLLGRKFETGDYMDRDDLSVQLKLPPDAVGHMLLELEKARFVNEVERTDDQGYALARPPKRIKIADLLDFAEKWQNDHAEGAEESEGWDYLDKLNATQKEAVGETTLRDLLDKKLPTGEAPGVD